MSDAKPPAGGDSPAFAIGQLVWTVQHMTVMHGRVVAVGPEFCSVRLDGPWTNLSYDVETVPTRQLRNGPAPGMQPQESFLDHRYRCEAILSREDDIAKVRAEAARLGLRCEGDGEQ